MNVYDVHVPEIHTSVVRIEAESPEDARRMVAEGEGEELDCYYVRTDDDSVDEWEIHEVSRGEDDGPLNFDPDPARRIPKNEAQAIINAAEMDILGYTKPGDGTFLTVYHIAPCAGHRYFIGLNDSDNLWEVDECTARHYVQ